MEDQPGRGPEATVVVTYDHGYALVPGDVRAVTPRLMVNRNSSPPSRGAARVGFLQYGPAGGFTLHERMGPGPVPQRTW